MTRFIHRDDRSTGIERSAARAVAALAIVAITGIPAAGRAEDGALTQLNGTAGCVSATGSGGTCAVGDALGGAQGVAITSNGLHVYVASGGSHGVAAFLRNPSSGQLSQLAGPLGCTTDGGSGGLCNPGKALLGAREVALSPKNDNLYVAAPGSDAIALFDRDKATGALLQLSGPLGCVSASGGDCAQVSTLNGARSVVVTQDGKNVYVAARDSDALVAFARDKKTGALDQIDGTDGCVSETGTGGACANGVALDTPMHVAASRDGRTVYVASVGSNGIAAIGRNKKTGVLTQLAGTAGCVTEDGTGGLCTVGRGLSGAFAVAVSWNGKSVYVASRDAGAIAVFARNKKTGVLTQLEGTAGCVSEDGSGGACADGSGLAGVVSVAVSRDGKHVYAASETGNAVAVFARDRKSGALTQLAPPEGCVSQDGSLGQCTIGRALTEARAVAVTRNGRHVYTAAATSDAIAAFERE